MDSLLLQPHDDAEILLVNDGSPDSSGAICNEYAQKHSCVRYYEKENGGVSSARNYGLDHASGDYVLFIDSDDYLYIDALSKLINVAKTTHADFINGERINTAFIKERFPEELEILKEKKIKHMLLQFKRV